MRHLWLYRVPAAGVYLLVALGHAAAARDGGAGAYCGPLSRQCPDAFMQPDAPARAACPDLSKTPRDPPALAAAAAGPSGVDLDRLRQLAAASHGLHARDPALPIYGGLLIAAVCLALALALTRRTQMLWRRQLCAAEALLVARQVDAAGGQALPGSVPTHGPEQEAVRVAGASLGRFERLAGRLLGGLEDLRN